jgi:hypothetical protein
MCVGGKGPPRGQVTGGNRFGGYLDKDFGCRIDRRRVLAALPRDLSQLPRILVAFRQVSLSGG